MSPVSKLKSALEKKSVRPKVKLRQRMNPMRKSKCRFCEDGMVLDEECNVIGHHFCGIDSYCPEVGCNPYCNYYTKKKEAKQ